MLKFPHMLVASAVACTLLSGCNETAGTAEIAPTAAESAPDATAGGSEKTTSSSVTAGSTPSRTSSSSAAPPATSPPVTAPPVTSPPVTSPPVTSPSVSSPPVSSPPVASSPVTDGSTTGAAPADPASRPIPAASSGVGATSLQVKPTSEVAPLAADGVGAMRLICTYSHMAFDDPIVFPGKPGASHLHTFFGNTSTDGNTTTESLSVGGSTCWGGTANRSSYWIPAMVDTATMRAIVPSSFLVYYKSGYNAIPKSQIQAPPNGLRVVAGNSVTQSSAKNPWEVWHYFECNDANRSQSMPLCQGGGTLSVSLHFPNCWDGVNLDSVDHRSHMAHSGGGVCPKSHPVAIPVVTLNIFYQVPNGESTANWRLSSDNYANSIAAGYSMHGDFWINWDEGIKNAWMEGCVRAGRDCHAHLIGDGRQYY